MWLGPLLGIPTSSACVQNSKGNFSAKLLRRTEFYCNLLHLMPGIQWFSPHKPAKVAADSSGKPQGQQQKQQWQGWGWGSPNHKPLLHLPGEGSSNSKGYQVAKDHPGCAGPQTHLCSEGTYWSVASREHEMCLAVFCSQFNIMVIVSLFNVWRIKGQREDCKKPAQSSVACTYLFLLHVRPFQEWPFCAKYLCAFIAPNST